MFRAYYILTYPLTLICLCLIAIYRKLVSRAIGKNCRFIPTCSNYSWDSIVEFGAVVGCYLTIKRLLRCRPSNCGGYDYPKLNLSGNYKWKC